MEIGYYYKVKYRITPFRSFMKTGMGLSMMDGTLSIKAKNGNEAFRIAESIVNELAAMYDADDDYKEIYGLEEAD